jgi:hypothetical protein
MSSTTSPDTGMTPEPRKPLRKRTWFRVTGGVAVAFVALIAVLSATNHPAAAVSATKPPPTATAPAKPKPAAGYPAEAADKALCTTYNADIKSGDTASIQAALDQADGSVSPGLAKDVQAIVDGSSLSQDMTNQIHVAMDCALVSVGKAPPAQGFSGTAPAAAPSSQPAAPAPATSQPATSQPAAPAPAAPAGPTASQQQALDAAQSYLNLGSGFSRQGLIDQLDSQYGNKFSVADATWAVDHSGADWNAQAVMAAKGYMALGTGFSRASLIDQLTSAYGSKFTYAQASYAADQVGL